MRFLVDIVHPAHVHFFRHLIADLEIAGHETTVVSRDKDVTCELLDAFGIPHTVGSRAPRSGMVGLAGELFRRDLALARVARSFRPDVVLTRNPSGVQAARLARVVGVFDTDDGAAVGIHYRAAAPFAHYITTPDCLGARYGPKQVMYPSYKPLAFLHPSRFTPDPSVLGELGVGPSERYAVVRLVALRASHDRGARGLTPAATRELVNRLTRHGRVFVSAEAALPSDLQEFAVPVRPHRFHDVLAHAALCVTDGQSVANEAAVLGVPSVRLASSCGHLPVYRELQERYGLVFEFGIGEERAFFAQVEELMGEIDNPVWGERRAGLLADKCDLTSWLFDFCTALPARRRRRGAAFR